MQCLSFREDSFVVSFGDANKFYAEDGKGASRYLDWLREKLEAEANSAVHVWRGDEIIGQIELGVLNDDSNCGYVNLYYLKPSERGKGLGSLLDEFSMNYFRLRGIFRVRLSVSPTNSFAFAFYNKMGWKDLGPRPGHFDLHFMEKQIEVSEI